MRDVADPESLAGVDDNSALTRYCLKRLIKGFLLQGRVLGRKFSLALSGIVSLVAQKVEVVLACCCLSCARHSQRRIGPGCHRARIWNWILGEE
ncbi:hypothetical protein PSENEW3n2_00001707 [Picochlorum sp. SENEW3]|nr:hypothetical protein PSENEW3n2_00001707 [Picochlorum sp. SENEW3]WPT14476.1 hypothetical protein PSENEW3_00001707 [Picochlorum sp. SENEW3]